VSPPASAAAARRPSRSTVPARRRVSGPVRAPVPARPARVGLLPGALAVAQRLERHRLLDRLIAGRAWIALVAFALIGIVTLQLGLLELNSSVGRALEREAALQRENAALAIESSELAAGNRVESLASRLDMQLVPMTALRFLTVRPSVDVRHAAAALGAAAKLAAANSEDAARAAASAASQGGALEAERASASQAGEQAGAQSASTPEAGAQSSAGEAVASAGSGEVSATQSGAQASAGESGAPTSQAGESAGVGEAESTPAGGTQAGAAG